MMQERKCFYTETELECKESFGYAELSDEVTSSLHGTRSLLLRR
jgi:hypothetical protein